MISVGAILSRLGYMLQSGLCRTAGDGEHQQPTVRPAIRVVFGHVLLKYFDHPVQLQTRYPHTLGPLRFDRHPPTLVEPEGFLVPR